MTINKLIFIATVFLFSCESEIAETVTNSEVLDSEAINAIEGTVSEVKGEIGVLKDSNNYVLLNLFTKNKKEVAVNLESLTKSEANKLYTQYITENYDLLEKITNSESALVLENRYSSNGTEAIQVSKYVNLLKKHNLEFREIGEGYIEIIPENDFYYNLFKDYVTEDYNQYLSLKKEENKTLYSADAGLMISFETLGDRIIDWENFVYSFPNSDLIKEVKDENRYYRSHYLLGLDNTPTHDRYNSENIYIYEENLKEFNRFITNYPQSPTTKLVLLFLEKFKEENISELINEEHKRLLGL